MKLKEQELEMEERNKRLRETIADNLRKREEQLKALNEQRERQRQDVLERKKIQQFL